VDTGPHGDRGFEVSYAAILRDLMEGPLPEEEMQLLNPDAQAIYSNRFQECFSTILYLTSFFGRTIARGSIKALC